MLVLSSIACAALLLQLAPATPLSPLPPQGAQGAKKPDDIMANAFNFWQTVSSCPLHLPSSFAWWWPLALLLVCPPLCFCLRHDSC